MSREIDLPLKFVQNVDLAISVMRDAGKWLLDSGKNPSEYWQLQILNKEYLFNHAEPDDFYVGLVGNKPAVACLLQDSERNQSWKSIDGDNPMKALYIHWLCIDRKYAGKNLPLKLIQYAANKARLNHQPFLRLDTEASRPKLMQIYEELGFTLMGIADGTAFYQRKV